jgi:peroxiredoxin Q/BCP
VLEPGQKAPIFEAKDHQGNTVRLEDYRGKHLVLWFYPKADTPGCTAEGCGFRDQIWKFEDKDARILGISFDTEDDNRVFAEKFDFNFPLLCDTSREVGLLYGACDSKDAQCANRISYLIDRDGKIVKAYPMVDAARHPDEVLCDIA